MQPDDLCNQSFPSLNHNVFMSNELSVLASHLSECIYSNQEPFSKRCYLIIPSNDVKEFLMQYLLKRHGSIFGIRFLSLAQSAELFTKLSLRETLFPPSHLNLMFYLESRIRFHYQNPSRESESLVDYIGNDPGRIIQMATELSHVFLHYAQYGHDALEIWEKEEKWQQLLWHEMKEVFDIPSQKSDNWKSPKMDINVHLFHITHLPKSLQKLYNHLAKSWEITHYFFSPTPYFWGDLLHEKKVAYVDKILRDKAHSLAERKGFTELSTDTNSLLSNLSTHGIPGFLYLHEFFPIEHYIEPKESTMLECLHSSLFHMQSEINKTPPDNTIEVHSAPTIMREVEVLLVNLLRHTKEFNLMPEEILILAPDINLYLPSIDYVFGGKNSPFGYIISDIQKSNESPYLRTMQMFFQFLSGRFQSEEIIELFMSKAFAQKHHIETSDIALLEYFIERWGVRFAFNEEMKEEILKSKGSSNSTFTHAYNCMLEEVATTESTLSLTEADRLGELFFLIEDLYFDARSLKHITLTLHDWLLLAEELMTKHFIATDDTKFLLKELGRLNKIASLLTDKFSYESFSRVWFEIFNQSGDTKILGGKPQIRFASMTAASCTTAKSIFLLGMDETAFPRQNTYRSLNQLLLNRKADHQPTIGEKDRYLFLQTIMLAKKSLVLSFISRSQADGKEQNGSLLIQELMHFIPSIKIQNHPPLPFSKTYFDHDNVNTPYYYLAKEYYKNKEPINTQWEILSNNRDEPIIINIKELQKLASHPVQFFCNESLGIYFDKIDNKLEQENGEIFLSYLSRARFKRDSLQKEIDDLLIKARKQGSLPSALFEKSASEEIREEFQAMQKTLKELDITKEEIYSLRFDLSCNKSIKHNDHLFVEPAIKFELDGFFVIIHGTLSNITPKGILSHGKDSFSEIWKELPSLLLLSHSRKDIPSAVNFLKTQNRKDIVFENAESSLKRYIEYFKLAKTDISPLMPTWVEETRKKGKEVLKKLLEEKKSQLPDPYLDFASLKDGEKWNIIIEELCKNIHV